MNHCKPKNRREFLKQSLATAFGAFAVPAWAGIADRRKRVMTVTGMIDVSHMRHTLPHEHVLVDFIGAEDVNPPRWDRDHVVEKVLPYLEEVRDAGCHTFVDCTPNYLGRDVALLKLLSEKTGLFIITNTGYYGGSNHKFLPPHAFSETADQLAQRWIAEWQQGIDGTTVKPGFIKISVNAGHLSDMSLKLIQAAAIAHLKTGLTIASHTGPAIPAFEQIEVLKSKRIDPSAFVWVHAQNESDPTQFVKAAREGAWISLDGLNNNNVDDYLSKLRLLKREGCLNRVLLSHDAGWYDPEKPEGGVIKPYTTLFRKMIPAMEQDGFTESDIMQLIQHNAGNALSIGVRKRKKK